MGKGEENVDRTENSSFGGIKVTTGPTFLHGELDLCIIEAKSLPNMDLTTARMTQCCNMVDPCAPMFSKRAGIARSGKSSIITSDPYVAVVLAGATVARTRVITNCENPLWDEHFCVPVAHPVVKVEFHVKDNDVFGAELIGVVEIPVAKIATGKPLNDWFPVMGSYGGPLKPYPELHVSIQFIPVHENPLYRNGVGAGPDFMGVPNTYFPLRKGGDITLYQDAHVPDNALPEIKLDDGKVYEHGRCWEDICHAILEAHHLIYIVGWSVYHPVKLVREPTRPMPEGSNLTLGELLKYKSEEGVRVVMLIWDDKTSHDKFLLKTEGVMQTHDEETRKFFRHSSVHCVLAPRYASNKLSIFKQQVVGTLYTHHQKCVILDTQASGNNRKITAFIGGLDLCDGRYDTPEHRLYGGLETVFKDDFHNPTFTTRTNIPRQPWHDLHCKVEGPAAYDVLKNFEQRWRKTAKWRDFRLKNVRHWHDDTLIKLDRISWILSPQLGSDGDQIVRVKDEVDPENWHVQIASKIIAKEQFAVYVVIPMWPEGVPTSAAVQEILFWQGQTMTMMYQIIAQAIEKAGLMNHPRDYLNFYCLGKREPLSFGGSAPTHHHTPSSESNPVAAVQKARRFMIYVHAKGMIVDDEYVLMGTANINQRSLDGSRDTEIAMGAYQPHHTWAKKGDHPNGQVYGYRMSLWAEHLGHLNDAYKQPQAHECMRKVNKMARHNWKAYVADETGRDKMMVGHLMEYPVDVSREGKVKSLPGFETFPDVGGKILGSSNNLPDALTT
ncbi:hypothetical protein MLD38_013393 [Melastoma candidum]|uniref:Uncharacterized protein n=1 Tax=Melastoma candidum TaxID=119954 RepID=A0ACB9R9E7_9MYRT|nr:hypothetical protein MLD38_013393 [Melastoma candidum]